MAHLSNSLPLASQLNLPLSLFLTIYPSLLFSLSLFHNLSLSLSLALALALSLSLALSLTPNLHLLLLQCNYGNDSDPES